MSDTNSPQPFAMIEVTARVQIAVPIIPGRNSSDQWRPVAQPLQAALKQALEAGLPRGIGVSGVELMMEER